MFISTPAGAVAKYCNEHVCVCVSVCPRAHLPNHTRDLYHVSCACCPLPWLGPFPTGWRNPNFGGNVAANCTVMGHYGELCKNGWIDRDGVLDEDSGGPKEPCIRCGTDPQWEGAIFGGCPGHSEASAIFAAAVDAKGIIQSPVTSCSRLILYAMQAQILFWKYLGAGDAAYRPRRGWLDCTTRAKSDVYDCLVVRGDAVQRSFSFSRNSHGFHD